MAINIHTADMIIAGIMFVSILIGVVRGFVKELISLVTWVVAIVLALLYRSVFAHYLTFTKMQAVREITAFVLIFVGVVFIGAIINYFIGSMVRRTPFSVADRMLGSLFGVLRGVFFMTILVLLGGLTPFTQENWWRQSYCMRQFEILAIWLKDRLPEENAKVFHFSDKPSLKK
jgi:membrane protein required for colicin V production